MVDFEPDLVEMPLLAEQYPEIVFDRNHAMQVGTKFMMELVIDSELGAYRQENVMADSETGQVPNWLIMLKIQGCHFCEVLEPNVQDLARVFHKEGNEHNYKVAVVDCTTDVGHFMCQYLYVQRLPRFVVFRPETNRYY